MSPVHRLLGAGGVAGAALLSACVTERVPVQPSPYVTLPSGAGERGGVMKSSSNSRVQLGLVPLGVVPHDGLTLPLVSTDARFIAAQAGPHPAWESMLPIFAKPETPARAPTIRVFAIVGWPGNSTPQNAKPEPTDRPRADAPQDAGPSSGNGGGAGVSSAAVSGPGAPNLRDLGPVSLPPGTILGRSADHRGFLVERPRTDGGRSIGFVPWSTLVVEWVIDDAQASAGATLLPETPGAYMRRIAWARRPDSAKTNVSVTGMSGMELVITDSTAALRRFSLAPLRDSVVFPVASSDPDLVFAVTLPPAPSGRPGIAAFSLAQGPRAPVHTTIRVEASPLAAFQMVAASQSPWPNSAGATNGPEGVALFDPESTRVIWFGIDGSVTPLHVASAIAVPVPNDHLRYLGTLAVASGREVALAYPSEKPSGPGPRTGGQPIDKPSWTWSAQARLLSGTFVPRAFIREDRAGLILLEATEPAGSDSGGYEMRVHLCDLTPGPGAGTGR